MKKNGAAFRGLKKKLFWGGVSPLLLASLLLARPVWPVEEPWSVSASEPVTAELFPLPAGQPQEEGSLAMAAYHFYQHYVSPLDNSSCHYYPTCSLYTAQAIRQYGWLPGMVMGADRLIRCHNGQKENPFDPPVAY